MTYKLEQYQEDFIQKISKELTTHNAIIAQLTTGGGKCLAKDTKVIMYDGYVKNVQDVKVGEYLIGPDSLPRKVLSTCSGEEMMYKITPVKGDSYTVNESHILSLRMNANASGYKKGEIVNICVRDYLKMNNTFKWVAKGYRSDCVEFLNNRDLEVDPYFVGLWLGDGNSRNSSITTGDSVIKGYLRDFANRNGCRIREEYNSVNSVVIHLPEIENKGRGGTIIGKFLSNNKLILNKHIPFEYKTSSEEDRLKLLAGLIDSDGYLHHNNFELTLKNERLVDDIIFVARSLGFAAYKKQVVKECVNNGVFGIYYKCLISGDTIRIPVLLDRKKAKQRKQIKNVLNVGISIEAVGIGEYFGFEIDGDRRFLLGDFTVTHNTVVFAAICNRYTKSTEKDVIIFVHKEELLEQTRATLYNWYGINSQIINADTTSLNKNQLFGERVRVFVAMVETFNNRSKKTQFLDLMTNVGLVIVDEAHLSNFKKIFIHFPLAMRIGFTGTPISATKKDPLNNYYTSIVEGVGIRDLIEHNRENPTRGVVEDITYTIKNVKRAEIIDKQKELGFKGEDFNDDIVGEALSKARQIQNTIDAYIKYAYGKKMLCFCANVKHSKLVRDAMIAFGINARHLDGGASKQERADTFRWLKNTPNAVLCNVGIATTGFDDPSVEGVILNKLTQSLTLYKQMCGRSARPYQYPDGTYKTRHIILDMGDNVIGGGHGAWSDHVDWNFLFHNPKTPRDGVAPAKECPECGCINAASARICKGSVEDFLDSTKLQPCEYEFPVAEIADDDLVEREMVLVSKNINVAETIQMFANRREYFAMFDLIRQTAYYCKKELEYNYIDADEFEQIYDACFIKIKEWIKLMGKRNNPWYKRETRNQLVERLREHGFIVNLVKDEVNEKDLHIG